MGNKIGFLRGLIIATGTQTFLVLRAAWDPNKFHERGPEQQTQRQGEEPLDCNKLSQVIRDNMFWHYAQMVVSLLGLTTSMMSWAEGCHCHEVLNTLSVDELPPHLVAAKKEQPHATCEEQEHQRWSLGLGKGSCGNFERPQLWTSPSLLAGICSGSVLMNLWLTFMLALRAWKQS